MRDDGAGGRVVVHVVPGLAQVGSACLVSRTSAEAAEEARDLAALL